MRVRKHVTVPKSAHCDDIPEDSSRLRAFGARFAYGRDAVRSVHRQSSQVAQSGRESEFRTSRIRFSYRLRIPVRPRETCVQQTIGCTWQDAFGCTLSESYLRSW